MQKLFVVLLVGFAALVIAVAFMTYGDVLLAAFLETSGKDSTLTGRTELWRAGLSLISEKPWFGVGYRAFVQRKIELGRDQQSLRYLRFLSARVFEEKLSEPDEAASQLRAVLDSNPGDADALAMLDRIFSRFCIGK